MNCKEVQRFVHAFLDRELEPQAALEVEGHLEACEECAKSVDFERWFKGELRRSVGAVLAPVDLSDKVRGALLKADRGDSVRSALPKAFVYSAIAAGVVMAIFLPGWLTPSAADDSHYPALAPPRPVIDYVAERHARSLPIEVTGPDAVSVSQWYQDKLDFAVNPPAFSGPDVQLVGGRISSVADRQAAHLVYEQNGRRITVVVFDGAEMPIANAQPMQTTSKRTIYMGESRGYPVAVWHQGGVAYAASSDLPQGDFVRLVSTVH